MTEIMLVLVLVTTFFMIAWWKWITRGELFSFESTMGFMGFFVGAYISYQTFGMPRDNDLTELIYFVSIPVALYITVETVTNVLTFRNRSIRSLSITNIEERTKKMHKLGVKKILKKTKAYPVDTSKKGSVLYGMDKIIPNYTLKYLVYDDPSSPEKTYGCFVKSDFVRADQAMAWKFQITEEEYQNNLIYET